MQSITVTMDELKELVSAAMTLSAAGFAGERPYLSDLTETIELKVPCYDGGKLIVPNDFLGSFQDLLWLFQERCTVTAPKPPTPERGTPRTHERITVERRGEPSAHEIIAATGLISNTLRRIGVDEWRITDLVALSGA